MNETTTSRNMMRTVETNQMTIAFTIFYTTHDLRRRGFFFITCFILSM